MLKMVDGTGIIGVDMICPLGVSTPQPPNYDRVELEGTGMLVLPNSLDAPLERLELGGKTEQVQTSGKNLFDSNIAKNKENYKEVTIAGSVIYAIELSLKPNTKYAFQCVIKSVPTTMNVGNSTIRHVVSDGQKRVITTNEDGKLYIGFSGNPDGEIHKIGVSIVDIQVEESTTVTPYEPYTGGKPAPSPEYPQEIKNVGKRNEEKQKYEVDVKVTGKNLLNLQKASEKVNWTQHSNFPGYYNFPVFVGRGNTVTISIPQKIPTGQGLFLSVCLTESGAREGWIAHNSNDSLNNTKLTYKATNDYIYLNAHSDTIAGMKKYFGNLQVEYGNVATPYQPYKEQTLTLTSDRPITKWDRLVEQGGQIGWLYQSAIDTDVKPSRLDLFPYGFSLFKDFGNGVYVYKVVNIKKAIGFQTSLCEQFKNKDGSYSTGDLFCYSDQPSIQMQYFVTDIPTLEEFKTWMETNPLTMVYQTVESQFVPLPQSEQNAIRALKTYYPTTVITADGGELDPDIKVTYRKEI